MTLPLEVRPGVELRMLSELQADTIFAATDRNREYLREWLPWVDPTRSTDDTRLFIRKALREIAENSNFTAGIWVDNAFAGTIGFHPHDWVRKKTEIGYWIDARLQGRGIVTDCVRALLRFGFETLGMNRIEIRCAAANQKSCAIPERLGFTFDGIQREAELLNGRFVDLRLYSLLRKEFDRPGR